MVNVHEGLRLMDGSPCPTSRRGWSIIRAPWRTTSGQGPHENAANAETCLLLVNLENAKTINSSNTLPNVTHWERLKSPLCHCVASSPPPLPSLSAQYCIKISVAYYLLMSWNGQQALINDGCHLNMKNVCQQGVRIPLAWSSEHWIHTRWSGESLLKQMSCVKIQAVIWIHNRSSSLIGNRLIDRSLITAGWYLAMTWFCRNPSNTTKPEWCNALFSFLRLPLTALLRYWRSVKAFFFLTGFSCRRS